MNQITWIVAAFPVVLILFVVARYWKQIKTVYADLTPKQITQVVFIYLAAVILATAAIYFIGNRALVHINSSILRVSAQILLLFVIFRLGMPLLQKAIKRVTDRALT